MIESLKRILSRFVAFLGPSTPRHDTPGIARPGASVDRADTAITAHDVLTLLDIMVASARGMLGSHPNWRASDDAVEFHQAAQRIRHVARRLIADAPAQPVRELIDTNQVITESEGMVSRLLPAGTELRLQLADTPATVIAERWEIERILLNLVLNACRRGLQDGSEIVIRTASMKQAPPGLKPPNIQVRSYISLTVSVVSMMARRGARVLASWNVERRGSDLTLAAVARTVQQLEGTLQVEIDSDRYMRVRVDLPLVVEGSDDEPESA